jgi:biotin carboxyl carrier protein
VGTVVWHATVPPTMTNNKYLQSNFIPNDFLMHKKREFSLYLGLTNRIFMVRTTINGKYEYRVEKKGKEFLVNEKPYHCQIQRLDAAQFQVILENQCFVAHLEKIDDLLHITINQNTYQLEVADEQVLMLEKLGISTKEAKGREDVKAPMPGLIVDVLVKSGDDVPVGQPLLILKAMKMENIIRSPYAGIIREVVVETNQKIAKDMVMIRF